MTATTVLIVDDHPGFRARARRTLEADGFEVVAEAGDLAEGLAMVEKTQPQLVLLDVMLPDGSGIAHARAFTEAAGEHGTRPQVVLISSYDADDVGVLPTGARLCGFIGKSELSGHRVHELLASRT